MDKPKGRNKDEENEYLIVGYQNGEKCDNGSPSSAENEQVDAWIREVDQIFIKTILKGWEVNSTFKGCENMRQSSAFAFVSVEQSQFNLYFKLLNYLNLDQLICFLT